MREKEKILGNLVADFDFDQTPRRAEPLAVHPKTTLTGTPRGLMSAVSTPLVPEGCV